MNVGSLFSGIGGIDLGLERAGMHVVWQCETDPYARAVLRKHWPSAALYGDVRSVGAANLAPVDLVCGGFPCQDISNAGKRVGIEGERSGLWSEYARIVRELRPRYVLVENVAALLARGLERVVGDLAACGYDAEWDCFPASAFGAPHQRDRLFVVGWSRSVGPLAHAAGDGQDRHADVAHGPTQQGVCSDTLRGSQAVADAQRDPIRIEPWRRDGASRASAPESRCAGQDVAHASGNGRKQRRKAARTGLELAGDGGDSLAHSDVAGLERRLGNELRERTGQRPAGQGGALPDAPIFRPDDGRRLEFSEGGRSAWRSGHWDVEPNVGRVADGIPSRVDRLRCLGNAVVPQVAQFIGEAIMRHAENNLR